MAGKPGRGAIQLGKRPPTTYYQIGAARFQAAPNRDCAGDEFKVLLDEFGVSSSEFMRRCVAAYTADPQIFNFLRREIP